MKKILIITALAFIAGIILTSTSIGATAILWCLSIGVTPNMAAIAVGAVFLGLLIWFIRSQKGKWFTPVALSLAILTLPLTVQAQSAPRDHVKPMIVGSLGNAMVKGAIASVIGISGVWLVYKVRDAFERLRLRLQHKQEALE